MNFKYTVAMMDTVSENDMDDVVKTLHYRITITDVDVPENTIIPFRFGTVDLDTPDVDSFIDFNNISEEIAVEWLKSKLDCNSIEDSLTKELEKNKYQLVEKIVIQLPEKYKRKSYVVVDGNFVCVDPFLGTKYHLLSDVKLSKIETLISKYPNFNSQKKKYLNKGIIKNKKISRFREFIQNSSNYLPFLKKAKYIGSMFVVRAIKINKENTDERVTSVNYHNKKIISVLSGKWNNCIYLARNLNLKK